DTAENPELMLSQVVREMEDGLARVKGYAATTIASERRLGRELQHHREQAVVWKERARTALASGQQELARAALTHKIQSEDTVSVLGAQHTKASESSQLVRTAV